MTELDLKLRITADNKVALSAIDKTKKAVKGFGGETNSAASDVKAMNADLKKTFSPKNRKNVNQTSDAISRLGNKTNSAASSFSKLGNIISIVGFGALGREIYKTNARFEVLEASLTVIEGSAKKAAEQFDYLYLVSQRMPANINQVTKAYIKLSALGLDASARSLESYANTASVMGKDVIQYMEAVADATTNEFERLKEFGIKSRQETDSVTFTFQGASTKVGKSAAEIEDYLRSIGEVQFAGAVEKQMKTMTGSLSNLGAAWDTFFDRFLTKESAIAETFNFIAFALDRMELSFVESIEHVRKQYIGVKAALEATGVAIEASIDIFATNVEYTFKGMVNAVMSSVADFFAWVADGAAAVGLDSLANNINKFSDSFRPATDTAKELTFEIARLEAVSSVSISKIYSDAAKKQGVIDKNLQSYREGIEAEKAAIIALGEAREKARAEELRAQREARATSSGSPKQTAAQREALQLTQSMRNANEIYNNSVAKTNALRDAGLISLKTYTRAMAGYQAALDKATTPKLDDTGIKSALDKADELIRDFTDQEFMISLNINGEAINANLDNLLKGFEAINGSGTGFDRIAKARDEIADSIKLEQQNMVKLALANKDYSKQQKQISELREKDNDLIESRNKQESQGYVDMAQGASQFFGEIGSMFAARAAQAEEGSQQQIKLQKISMGLMLADVAVAGTVAIINAFKGGFVPGLAMSAIVGAQLASIGIQMSDVGKVPTKTRQETQGSGSTLGDAEVKSQSFNNYADFLKDSYDLTLDVSNKMLRQLELIQANTANFVVDLSTSKSFEGISSSAEALRAKMAGEISGAFAHSEIKQLGISFNASSVMDVISGGIEAEMFAEVKRWKFRKRKIRKESITAELDQELQNSLNDILQSSSSVILTAAADLTGMTRDALVNSLSNIVIDIGSIDLLDLSLEEQQAAVLETIGKASDDVVFALLPNLSEFQLLGEGLYETLGRVAGSMSIARTELSQLGITAISYADIEEKRLNVESEVTRQSILLVSEFDNLSQIMTVAQGTASELVDLYIDLTEAQRESINAGLGDGFISSSSIGASGGLSELQSNLEAFNELVLTDAEKLSNARTEFVADFTKLGLDSFAPQTAEQFKNIAQGIDASTESGQKTLALFLSLVPAFNDWTDAVSEFEASTADMTGVGDPIIDMIAQIAKSSEGFNNLNFVKSKLYNARGKVNTLDSAEEEIDLQLEISGLVKERYDIEASNLRNLITASRQISGYLTGLEQGNLSILTPDQKLSASRSDFNKTLSLAKGGDSDALRDLTKSASAFLKNARSIFASSTVYTDIYNQVTSALKGFVVPVDSEEAYQARLLSLQESAMSELTTIAAVLESAFGGNVLVDTLNQLSEGLTQSDVLLESLDIANNFKSLMEFEVLSNALTEDEMKLAIEEGNTYSALTDFNIGADLLSEDMKSLALDAGNVYLTLVDTILNSDGLSDTDKTLSLGLGNTYLTELDRLLRDDELSTDDKVLALNNGNTYLTKLDRLLRDDELSLDDKTLSLGSGNTYLTELDRLLRNDELSLDDRRLALSSGGNYVTLIDFKIGSNSLSQTEQLLAAHSVKAVSSASYNFDMTLSALDNTTFSDMRNYLKAIAEGAKDSATSTSNDPRVTDLYTSGLGIAGDQAGIDYWTNELKTKSYAKVIEDFAYSAENEYGADFNDDFIPKFAKGGVTNQPSIFGEAGWEAAVPLPDGRTIPVTINNQTKQDNSDIVNAILKGAEANAKGQMAIKQELAESKAQIMALNRKVAQMEVA